MSYLGVAFHSKYPNGKKSGEITLSERTLVFKNDSDTLRFDLYTLDIERGGASNALIYFKHKSHPEWVLYTSDKSILKEPAFKEFAQTKRFLDQHSKRRGIVAGVVLFVCALIALMLFGLFSSKAYIVKYVASKVPVRYEKMLGDKMFPLATTGKQLMEDSLLLSRLQIIAKPLQVAVADTNFKFTYYIVNDAEMNAYALPGGHVVIHSGLIMNADSYEELAGVLAHELSHVTLRHHMRGIVNNVGLMALLGGVVGGDDGFYSTIVYGGAQLGLLNYSREMETEADNQGFEYMVRAKIDPKGMVTFFEKLEKKHDKDLLGKEANKAISFLSTHPETKERIDNLNSKINKLDKSTFVPLDTSYTSFKELLGKRLLE